STCPAPMLPPDAALVSINDHLVEPPDLWHGRPDAPHVAVVDGEERWIIGTSSLPVAALSILTADGAGRATALAQVHPAVHDPRARLTAMDLDGVAGQTLLPHVVGFAGERLRHLDNIGSWDAAARRYNDFVLREFCAAAPGRLIGVAIVAFGDPLVAAR